LPSAAGASGRAPAGYITSAFQYRDGSVSVRGFGYDRNHPSRHPRFCLMAGGHCVRFVYPDKASPRFDRARHIAGPHAFVVRLRPQRSGVVIGLWGYGSRPVRLDAVRASTPGSRVVHVARRYVGGRYTYGGASPRTGFDCSGYTMFSYRHGRAASLPHNAEAQRHTAGMRRIRRADARPGDLVFYMSGGSAYHVAIYAGHGYQYSATDPQQGVRYQPISSRNVLFGTDWHH
jgi:cell wall-associated NlpC family hydrolase